MPLYRQIYERIQKFGLGYHPDGRIYGWRLNFISGQISDPSLVTSSDPNDPFTMIYFLSQFSAIIKKIRMTSKMTEQQTQMFIETVELQFKTHLLPSKYLQQARLPRAAGSGFNSSCAMNRSL